MNRYPALLAGALLALGLAHGAYAADLPVKAAPPPAPAPSWTGFYIGAHAGAAWQSAKDWSFFDPNGAVLPFTLSGRDNALGAVGGLQAGYNWQFAPAWVAGIEGDISWASLSDRRSAGSLAVTPGLILGTTSGIAFTFGASPCAACNVQMSANTEWLSSVRGRLGFVGWGNTLLYATGGVAWANTEYAASFATSTGSASQTSTFTITKSGWVAGGGAEWMATSNFLIRAEYLFYNINNGNVNATAAFCGVVFGCLLGPPFAYTWSSYNVQVARIAASYKF